MWKFQRDSERSFQSEDDSFPVGKADSFWGGGSETHPTPPFPVGSPALPVAGPLRQGAPQLSAVPRRLPARVPSARVRRLVLRVPVDGQVRLRVVAICQQSAQISTHAHTHTTHAHTHTSRLILNLKSEKSMVGWKTHTHTSPHTCVYEACQL